MGTRFIARLTALTLAGLLAACAPAPAPVRSENAQDPVVSPSRIEPRPRPSQPTPSQSPPPRQQPLWRLDGPTAADDELAGYTTQASIAPGETLQLKVNSSTGAVAGQVQRIGHYGTDGALEVADLPSAPGVRQPACTLSPDRTVDCSAWQVTHTIPTDGWRPGLYVVKLHNEANHWRYIPFVVRSADLTGSVVFVSATATWQAYNTFGGYSLYHGPANDQTQRAYRVSFNRPYAGDGAANPQMYEMGLIRHIESLGVPVTYLTSQDVEAAPATLNLAKAVVFSGHDEYWTPAMRHTVESARDKGVNLLFMGANTMYWRIRWEDGGRTVVAYKKAALDPVQGPDTTDLFRNPPDANPEARVLGGQYTCLGDYQPMVVTAPNFWAFDGTRVRPGQQLPRLVGGEVDALAATSPKSVQVVAHSPYACKRGRNSSSDMTYYTAPSGAGVFNAGSFGWSNALAWGTAAPAESIIFVRTVVTNLVTEAAKGPLAPRHPAG